MAMVMTISNEEIEASKGEKLQLQLSHFGHRHPLAAAEVHEEEKGTCSGCEHGVAGPAYACTKAGCGFLLHGLCSDLPRRLRHRGHAAHPLALRPPPPRGFTCGACGREGHGFTYRCGTCEFDLHVECAALPEVEHRGDHVHPLVLVCDDQKRSGKNNMDGWDLVCYGCGDRVAEGGWMYCCLACRCALHLACAQNW